MPKTALLPSVTAIRMVWSMTGLFSNDTTSIAMAQYVENSLKSIEDQAQQAAPEEKAYITGAIAAMKASLRSLDTAYKGRTLNFEENEQLRSAYLEEIKESLAFGTKAKDYLNALPMMAAGSAGGATLANFLNKSSIDPWLFGLLAAAVGFWINLWISRHSRRKRQILYVHQDYERTLYFDQYNDRVVVTLRGLFMDLERLHKRSFGENFEEDVTPGTIEKIIEDILAGVKSTFCPFTHKHMREKKITPELWTLCECGNPAACAACPFWEGDSSERVRSILPRTGV
ncbi:hypothetical protein KJ612_09085 [Myxococcota bacterium]|nr:hypothetical protein [Myxococcota bacterium]